MICHVVSATFRLRQSFFGSRGQSCNDDFDICLLSLASKKLKLLSESDGRSFRLLQRDAKVSESFLGLFSFRIIVSRC